MRRRYCERDWMPLSDMAAGWFPKTSPFLLSYYLSFSWFHHLLFIISPFSFLKTSPVGDGDASWALAKAPWTVREPRCTSHDRSKHACSASIILQPASDALCAHAPVCRCITRTLTWVLGEVFGTSQSLNHAAPASHCLVCSRVCLFPCPSSSPFAAPSCVCRRPREKARPRHVRASGRPGAGYTYIYLYIYVYIYIYIYRYRYRYIDIGLRPLRASRSAGLRGRERRPRSPVGDISVVTLMTTDTTLDGQKAEKGRGPSAHGRAQAGRRSEEDTLRGARDMDNTFEWIESSRLRWCRERPPLGRSPRGSIYAAAATPTTTSAPAAATTTTTTTTTTTNTNI